MPSGSAEAQLVERYLERSGRHAACSAREVESEQALLEALDRAARRTAPFLILADSRGKLLISEEFASALRGVQNAGTQAVVLAIGPADGWTDTALRRANLVLAFGKMTLPHELAAAVAAEQIYRALTILAGHPYHSGH